MLHAPKEIRVSGEPRSEARKPKSKAAALGQVFTQAPLAERMAIGLGLAEAPEGSYVLDPCAGPRTFPNAIEKILKRPIRIDAVDIDQEMCGLCASDSSILKVQVSCEDYLFRRISGEYDYAILNPPYVRQEWIRNKGAYREELKRKLGVEIPGTANLYVYFIVKAIYDLRCGGKFCCIVYDSWQSTIYGAWLKNFLDQKCRKWWTEPAPATPFDGRLIDATIIYAEIGRPQNKPSSSAATSPENGFATVDDLFVSCRGLRLKQASFFMTGIDKQVSEGSTPFVKKIVKIPGYIVPSEHPEAALLVERGDENQRVMDALELRLQAASMDPESNVSILNWARERPEEWAFHKSPPKHSLLFNYYLRHRPRHILNPACRAFSDNFYGATPKDDIDNFAWLAAMNSTVSVAGMMKNARNQGSGLAKLQLFEYRSAEVLDLRQWSNQDVLSMQELGRDLVEVVHPSSSVVRKIDELVFSVMAEPRFAPDKVTAEFDRIDQAAKQPIGFK